MRSCIYLLLLVSFNSLSAAEDKQDNELQNCNGVPIHPGGYDITIEGVNCTYNSRSSREELVEYYDLYFVTYRWRQNWIREYNEPIATKALYTFNKKERIAYLTIVDNEDNNQSRHIRLQAGLFVDVAKDIIEQNKQSYKR